MHLTVEALATDPAASGTRRPSGRASGCRSVRAADRVTGTRIALRRPHAFRDAHPPDESNQPGLPHPRHRRLLATSSPVTKPHHPARRPTRRNHRRQGRGDPPGRRLPARAGAPADRGRPGRGQDDALPGARAFAGAAVSPHPVHERPAAGRYPRQLDLRSRDRPVRVPSRADLRAGRPHRRGQSRHAQDPERAARGDGGEPGLDRRREPRRCRSRSSSSPRRIRASRSAPSRCPESQLDRFLMRLELGFPEPRQRARDVHRPQPPRVAGGAARRSISGAQLGELQARVPAVHASPALLDYLQDLLAASRREHAAGLSPRAGLALLHASQAWALVQGREMVLPEDVQAVAIPVMAHRLESGGNPGQLAGRDLARHLVETVPVA